jgi:hypothetical protein
MTIFEGLLYYPSLLIQRDKQKNMYSFFFFFFFFCWGF